MKNMRKIFYALLAVLLAACGSTQQGPIDREALLQRNNPQVTKFDSLASLSVGNGEFAFTVDATGLQTFPIITRKVFPWVHRANGDGIVSRMWTITNRPKC